MAPALLEFRRFPNLPKELQLKIWGYAIIPRAIEIAVGIAPIPGSNEDQSILVHASPHRNSLLGLSFPGDMEAYCKFVVHSLIPPLLLACRDSRNIALAAYGDTRHCIAISFVDESLISHLGIVFYQERVSRPSLCTFYFDPSRDTILFSSPEAFNFFSYYRIYEGDLPVYGGNPAPVRSIAINGLFSRARVAHFKNVNGKSSQPVFGSLLRGGMVPTEVGFDLVNAYPSLEELVLVNKSAEQLREMHKSDSWWAKRKEYRTEHWGLGKREGDSVEEIIDDDPAETKRKVDDMLQLLRTEIIRIMDALWNGQRLVEEDIEKATKRGEKVDPKRFRKHWSRFFKDPVFIQMHENEFIKRYS